MADAKISSLPASTTPLAGTEVLPIVQSGVTKQISVANLTIGRSVTTGPLTALGGNGNQFVLNNNGEQYVQQNFSVNSILKSLLYWDNSANKFTLGSTGATSQTAIISTGVERMVFDASGNALLNTGNLVIGTAGKGIDFSADGQAAGMTSELLDDYEEGTWTPTDDSGAGLSLSAVGNYTKVGRQVFWQAIVVYPTTADGSNARIGGFPFTPALGSNQGRAGGYISYASKGDLEQVLQFGTQFNLYKANAVNATNAELSGGEFYFAGLFVV